MRGNQDGHIDSCIRIASSRCVELCDAQDRVVRRFEVPNKIVDAYLDHIIVVITCEDANVFVYWTDGKLVRRFHNGVGVDDGKERC